MPLQEIRSEKVLKAIWSSDSEHCSPNDYGMLLQMMATGQIKIFTFGLPMLSELKTFESKASLKNVLLWKIIWNWKAACVLQSALNVKAMFNFSNFKINMKIVKWTEHCKGKPPYQVLVYRQDTPLSWKTIRLWTSSIINSVHWTVVTGT